MPIKLKNNVVGFLATAINASDTGLVMQSGNGASFPVFGTADYCYATLISTGGTIEIVKITARVGDTITVVRAQEATSATGFAAGSRIELRMTAQSIVDVAAVYGGTYANTLSVRNFGAVADGVTDDTAAINAAIASAVALGGADIYFDAGVYAVSSQIVIDVSGVRLIGRGSGFYATNTATVPLTQIKYIGAPLTGPVVLITSRNGAAELKVFGVAFIGMGVDANNAATRAVDIFSVNTSDFDFAAEGATDTQVFISAVALLADATSPQFNNFKYIRVTATGSQNGINIDTAQLGGNLSKNFLGYIYARHSDGYGVRLGNCDNNVFQLITCVSGGTGDGVIFAAGDGVAANGCRGNMVINLQSDGPIISQGTASGAAVAENNVILQIDKENAAPAPIIEAGSTLQYGQNNDITGVLSNFSQVAFSPSAAGALNARAAMSSTEAVRFRGNNVKLSYFDDGAGNEWSLGFNGGTFTFRRQGGTGFLRNDNPPTDIGAACLRFISINADALLDSTHSVVFVTAFSGSVIITLPLANSYGVNRSGLIQIRRIDSSANTVTVQRQGTDSLNGGTTETLSAAQGKTYVCTTSAWYSF